MRQNGLRKSDSRPRCQQHPPRHHGAEAQVVPGQLALRGRDLAVHIGRVDLIAEALEQLLGIVRVSDRAPPHRHDLVVRAQEHAHCFRASRRRAGGRRASRRSHSGVFGSACSRLMVSIGICDRSMKSFSRCSVSGVSVSRPRMMPDVTLEPVTVERLDRLQHRDGVVVALLASRRAHRPRASRCRRTCRRSSLPSSARGCPSAWRC